MKKYVLKPRPVPLRIQRDLDEEQQNAVLNSKGRSIVIAGPGSGKTRVITYKLVHILSQGVKPSEVMLVTFTRAAAREMINRAKEATGYDLTGLIAGTFHSISNHFLRKYAKVLDYDSNYTILDREDAKSLMTHARGKVLEDYQQSIRRMVPKASVLLDLHSFMMNTMSDIERAIEEKMPMFFGDVGIIERIFENYEREKRKQNVMDYDDLLVNFLKILEENNDIREKLSRRFRWILVDEFQDTNLVQYLILENLASFHGNIFVVGDDAQSIYSFRGARYENVADFMKREGTLVFKIQTNYRSTDKIVNLINSLIPRNSVPKTLRAVRKGDKLPIIVKTFDEDEQALFLGQRIEELIEEGTSPEEIAVLYRSSYSSLKIEMELARRHIPYRILSGLRFTELAHVKDVLAFLKVIQNPKDVISWIRIAKMFGGIGDKTASSIATHVLEKHIEGSDIADTLRRFKPSRKSDYDSLVRTLDSISHLEKPREIMEKLLEVFYSDYLYTTYPDASSREEDLKKLEELAGRYESLERFLSDISTAEDISVEEMEKGGKVTLTTVHQAKGLEWKVVFVISVNVGDFPNWMAMRDGKLDEEERLFYVAITRAKDELYIVHQSLDTTYPMRGNRFYYRRGEGFVERIPENLVEMWEID